MEWASIARALAESAANHLAEYGVELRGDISHLTQLQPAPIALDAGGRRIEISALYLSRMSATEALRAAHEVPSDAPLLVIGPRIHESSAATLRARDIWYVDGAGNAYLRHDGLVVDVRGRRGESAETKDRHSDSGASNPFTPKRAQVGLALLSSPSLADAPFREIAERSGVSVGMAKGTLDTLRVAGFIEQLGPRRRLIREQELLNLWTSAYPGGLARASTLLTAYGDVHNWSPPHGIDFAISGEQALRGTIKNAETLTLYVHSYIQENGHRRPPRELMIENRWHRDDHGNIVIRELFWRDLPGIGGVGTAPPALVYADLLASQEPRQAEVARAMRGEIERMVQR